MGVFGITPAMPSESENSPEAAGDLDEKELCVSCLFPNDPLAHFCAKCGAPVTSYAATAPFESIFAEGHVYRQAADRPRTLVVVLGIWLIFGPLAFGGAAMLFAGSQAGMVLFGAFILPISLAMIWKTTRSYYRQARAKDEGDHT